MSDSDPHIHVEHNVLEAGPAVRNLIVSMLDRATDAPNTVTTGCGIRVPYAMTSARPESVTCLACRDHAHHEYLRLADHIERLGPMPGIDVASHLTAEGVQRLRNLAERFAG